MSLIQALASSNYIVVNKSLVKSLGLCEAVLLGELCSEYCYWELTNQLEDGMFYATIDKVTDNTGLSAYEQRKAIAKLEEYGILTTVTKGLPAKRYFKLNETQLLKFSQLAVKNLHSSNNTINNNKELDNTNVLSENPGDFLVSPTTTPKSSTKRSKPNKYQACMAIVDDFTTDQEVRDLLKQFFSMRSANKDKPFNASTFKGMLNKLRSLTDSKKEACAIIQQAIDRCYLTFYPVTKPKYNNNPEIITLTQETISDDEYEEAIDIGEKF